MLFDNNFMENKLIKRDIEKNIKDWLFKGKIIILYGARQVGKTTLAKKLLKEYNDRLDGYEFKWGKGKASAPKEFLAYKNSRISLINRDNYQDFLMN